MCSDSKTIFVEIKQQIVGTASGTRMVMALSLSLVIHVCAGILFFSMKGTLATPAPKPLEITVVDLAMPTLKPLPGEPVPTRQAPPLPPAPVKPLNPAVPLERSIPQEDAKKTESVPTPVPAAPTNPASHSGPKVANPPPATEVSRPAAQPASPSRNSAERNLVGPVTGPSFDARYLNNPVPAYPATARRLKLQGTVIVRVLVSAEGNPQSVTLEKSSGTRLLDDAALAAVKGWRFVPAQRGAEQVPAWVDIPLRFKLN